MIEFGDGSIFKINNKKTQQESILKRLLTPVDGEKEAFKGVKIVSTSDFHVIIYRFLLYIRC